MEDGIQAMAGNYSPELQTQRSMCVDRLQPVVTNLIRQGYSTNAVIAALAQVTVLTLEKDS